LREKELLEEEQRKKAAETEAEEERKQKLIDEDQKQLSELQKRLEEEKKLDELNALIADKTKLLQSVSDVNPATFKVQLDATEDAQLGCVIAISWNITGGVPNKKDWIGLYLISEKNNRNYATYVRVSEKVNSIENIRAPYMEGIYEFRYLLNGRYDQVAGKSNPMLIGPKVMLHTEITESVIDVTWETASKLSNRDFIGLYEFSELDNRKYLAFKYITGEYVRFNLPRKPGNYQVRYFSYNSTMNELSVSQRLIVLDNDTLIASTSRCKPNEIVDVKYHIESIDGSNRNWVGLFLVGATNSQYIDYKFCTYASNGTLQFTLPKAVGQYEFRLFPCGKYYDIKRSKYVLVL